MERLQDLCEQAEAILQWGLGEEGECLVYAEHEIYTVTPRWYREMRPLTVAQTCRILQHWKQDKMQMTQ